MAQFGGFKFGSQSYASTEDAGGKPATGFKFGTSPTTDSAKPAVGGGGGVNPLVTNGLSHSYHLDESIFIYRGFRVEFLFLFHFSIDFL